MDVANASHVRISFFVSQLRHIRIICMHIQMGIFSTLAAEFTSPNPKVSFHVYFPFQINGCVSKRVCHKTRGPHPSDKISCPVETNRILSALPLRHTLLHRTNEMHTVYELKVQSLRHWNTPLSLGNVYILLMEEMLHHLGCIKPCE